MVTWALVTLGFGLACLAARGAPRASLLALLLLGGVAARVPHLISHPESSDDLYRYLFEGRVWAAGENPFYFPPDSPRLKHLRDDDVYPHINNKELATIYPPTAQGLFLLGHLAGGTHVAWKSLLLLLELAAAVVLARILLARRASLVPVALFFWNPLLVLESSEGGHVDAAGASLLMLALCAVLAEKRCTASILAMACTLVKPVTAPLLLLFCRKKSGLCGMAVGALLAAAALAVMLWPPVEQPFHEQRLDALEVAPRPGLKAQDVLGRYHLDIGDPLSLSFDGMETATLFDDPILPGAQRSFYLDERGSVIVFDKQTGTTLAWFAMSRDGIVLRGEVLQTWGTMQHMGPVRGIRGSVSPIMSWRQYFTRWSGFSPVYDQLLAWLGSRTALRLFEVVILCLLAGLFYFRKTPLPESALCLATIILLLTPVLYAWYFLWLLPGAVLLRDARMRVVIAIILAAAPLLHLVPA